MIKIETRSKYTTVDHKLTAKYIHFFYFSTFNRATLKANSQLLRLNISGLGMAIGLWFWIQSTGGMNRLLVALGGVALGGIVYLVGVTVLKVPEIQILTSAVVRRLKR